MDLMTLVEAAYFHSMRLVDPEPWIGHVPFAAWLIQTIKPSIFLELGTHSGNSYLAFCQAVQEGKLPTRCYAVDTWKGDEHAGFYGEEVFSDLNSYHANHYSNFSRLLRMTFDEAVSYFNDGSIELLHIDGFHTYEAVKHDFTTWLPKLAPHAMVIFHDTNVRENEFGIWKFWQELCGQYPLNFEFLHSHGLGVLQLADGQGDFYLEWLRSDFDQGQMLKEYFANLGQFELDRYHMQAKIKSFNELKVAADKIYTELQANQALVEEHEQKSFKLQEEIAKNQQTIQSQISKIKENEQIIKDLSAKITKNQQTIQSLISKIKENEQIIKDLSAKIAKNQQTIQSLISKKKENEQIIKDLSAKITKKEQIFLSYAERIANTEQRIKVLSAQLNEKEQLERTYIGQVQELAEIKSSHAWRLVKIIWRLRTSIRFRK